MRTTVSIDEHLLAAARQRAHARSQTLSQVVEDALRAELARDGHRRGPAVPVFSEGTGVRPGIDLRSNRAVQAVLDDGVALHQLR